MAGNREAEESLMLELALERGKLTAIEGQVLREKLVGKRSYDTNVTMEQMLIRHGFLTHAEAEEIRSDLASGVRPGNGSQGTLLRATNPGGEEPLLLAPEAGMMPTPLPPPIKNKAAAEASAGGKSSRASKKITKSVKDGRGNRKHSSGKRPKRKTGGSSKKSARGSAVSAEDAATLVDGAPTLADSRSGTTNPPQRLKLRKEADPVLSGDQTLADGADTMPGQSKTMTDGVAVESKRPLKSRGAGVSGVNLGVDSTARNAGATLLSLGPGASGKDKLLEPGTIINTSDRSISQFRSELGLDDGVRLVSSKLKSTVAKLRNEAQASKRRYIVEREIARGGMGKVLEVEDTELRRAVALKVLRKEMLGRHDVVVRFLEEAQITGQLEHPNIVPVHEMGVDGAGNLYFTMKYVEGQSLSEIFLRLREGNRDTEREYPLLRLLDVFLKICEGVSFAHARGVIHRDLKPSNIMVGRFGEVQIMDWGVSKVVGRTDIASSMSIVSTDRQADDMEATMLGAIIGTPSYMSPEQARGDVDEIGPHSDVFSLGVILYEMLSLRSPWTANSSDKMLEQVREMTPIKPGRRNLTRNVPAELEQLTMKCLAKDVHRRVSSVRELAENVRNYIDGRNLGAVDYSVPRLVAKWLGRHRREATFIGAMLLVILLTIVGVVYWTAMKQRELIEADLKQASELLAGWRELANKHEYEKALTAVVEARNLYGTILLANEDNTEAANGQSKADFAQKEILSLRYQHTVDVASREKLEKYLNVSRAELTKAVASDGFDVVRGSFAKAFGFARAAVVEYPENLEALELLTEVALAYARKAMDREKWSLAEELGKTAASTGVLLEQVAKFEEEWQLRRPSYGE